MIATAKTTSASPFPRHRIARAIEHALPRGNSFKLHVADSTIGNLKIVRVVTPAWKNLRPWQRIGKLRPAIEGELSAAEQKGILRVSVLTPEEFQELVVDSPVFPQARPSKTAAPKKLAVKRKAPPRRKTDQARRAAGAPPVS